MDGLAPNNPFLAPAEMPKIPDTSFVDDLTAIWNMFSEGVTDTFDMWIGNTYFPNETHRNTWGSRILDYELPSLTQVIPPPTGFLDIIKDAVTTDAARDIVVMKATFPLLRLEDVIVMSVFGRQVADPSKTPPFGFRMGARFDPLDSMNVVANMHIMAEVYRTNYTMAQLAKMLRPWLYHESRERLRQSGETVEMDKIDKTIFRNTIEFWEAMDALTQQVLAVVDKKKIEDGVFPARYATNIFYHQLPYERFRYEAVCQIDEFYLFLEEISNYTETYTYPFQKMDTLYGNYYYRTGGIDQKITIRATLHYLYREAVDYFVRLANSQRPLRFVVSYDAQVRKILILSVNVEYKFQPPMTKYQNPQPAVAKFTINAAVILSPYLTPFQSARYGADPNMKPSTPQAPKEKPQPKTLSEIQKERRQRAQQRIESGQ